MHSIVIVESGRRLRGLGLIIGDDNNNNDDNNKAMVTDGPGIPSRSGRASSCQASHPRRRIRRLISPLSRETSDRALPSFLPSGRTGGASLACPPPPPKCINASGTPPHTPTPSPRRPRPCLAGRPADSDNRDAGHGHGRGP